MDVISASKLLSTQQNQGLIWMNRIYYSVYFRSFYVLLLLVNLACIAWALFKFGNFPDEVWFLCLEGCLAVMILVEVCWRMCVQGVGRFWCSLANVTDVLISAAAMAALGLAAADVAISFEGLSGQVVLIVRSGLQYLRLLLFIKNQRKAQDTLQMINFSELAEAPKPIGQSHVLVEEEEKVGAPPHGMNTIQEAESEDQSGRPRTLMIPRRA